MSVHQESFSAHSANAHEEVQVENEITPAMIIMLLTALGGAVLGTLLTLFVLSLINGGTLRYGGGASRLDGVELAYSQLSENVNINTLNMQGQTEQFATDINSINEIVTGHSRSINQMAPMVARTSANSDQTTRLMNALEDVFSTNRATTSADDLMVPAVGEEEVFDTGPMMSLAATVKQGNNIPTGMVAVLPFVDKDSSGVMDPGEVNELGITASLIDSAGMAVATMDSGDAGMNFTDIMPGNYELVIENGGNYDSLVGQTVPVEVDASDEFGQLIFLGIAEEGTEPASAPEDEAVEDEVTADEMTGEDHAAADAEEGDHAEGDAAGEAEDHNEEADHDADAEDHGEEESHD